MVDRNRGRRVDAPRPERRRAHPNLSPTRPPVDPGDLALWPAWTRTPIEQLDLDAFDDSGQPLARHGCRKGVTR